MGEANIIVLARLRGGPILAFVALGLALLGLSLWEIFADDDFAGTRVGRSFGPLAGPVAIAAACAIVYLFMRMWRERGQYLHHDGVTLFKGSDGSWPLASIRDVVVTSNWLGLRSLRIDVGRGNRPELAKAYMLVETPEAVQRAVARAAEEARRD
jgi:hypothetical protein